MTVPDREGWRSFKDKPPPAGQSSFMLVMEDVNGNVSRGNWYGPDEKLPNGYFLPLDNSDSRIALWQRYTRWLYAN